MCRVSPPSAAGSSSSRHVPGAPPPPRSGTRHSEARDNCNVPSSRPALPLRGRKRSRPLTHVTHVHTVKLESGPLTWAPRGTPLSHAFAARRARHGARSLTYPAVVLVVAVRCACACACVYAGCVTRTQTICGSRPFLPLLPASSRRDYINGPLSLSLFESEEEGKRKRRHRRRMGILFLTVTITTLPIGRKVRAIPF